MPILNIKDLKVGMIVLAREKANRDGTYIFKITRLEGSGPNGFYAQLLAGAIAFDLEDGVRAGKEFPWMFVLRNHFLLDEDELVLWKFRIGGSYVKD